MLLKTGGTSISLGAYPVISPEDARFRRLDRQGELANGLDPARVRRTQANRQLDQERSQFPVIAREWLAERKLELKPKTFQKAEMILDGDLDARKSLTRTI